VNMERLAPLTEHCSARFLKFYPGRARPGWMDGKEGPLTLSPRAHKHKRHAGSGLNPPTAARRCVVVATSAPRCTR
jgi:hypothetical protein